MRTKAEVLKKIKQLREFRDLQIDFENPESVIRRKQATNFGILLLQAMLGYKVEPHYWCCGCGDYHKGIECPQCGSKFVNQESEKIAAGLKFGT